MAVKARDRTRVADLLPPRDRDPRRLRAGAPRLADLPVAAAWTPPCSASALPGLRPDRCLHAGCCYGAPGAARRALRTWHVATASRPSSSGVRRPRCRRSRAAIARRSPLPGSSPCRGAAPGVALVIYVAAYGVARFALEEWRGDAVRRYWLGFSEAQWTSLALTALAAAGRRGPRACHPRHGRDRRRDARATRSGAAARRATAATLLPRLNQLPSHPVAVPTGRGMTGLARPRAGRSPPLRLSQAPRPDAGAARRSACSSPPIRTAAPSSSRSHARCSTSSCAGSSAANDCLTTSAYSTRQARSQCPQQRQRAAEVGSAAVQMHVRDGRLVNGDHGDLPAIRRRQGRAGSRGLDVTGDAGPGSPPRSARVEPERALAAACLRVRQAAAVEDKWPVEGARNP